MILANHLQHSSHNTEQSALASDSYSDESEILLPLMELMDGTKAQLSVDVGWITSEVEQSFTNHQTQAIEANYTFPIPSGGILLSIRARIGERELIGEVQAKAQAQTNYDDAISQGDTAMLVTDLGNGLMQLSLGNLLAHETMVIHYCYVQPTRISHQQIRLHLPTTVAPKYGNPQLNGMQPLAYPTYAAIAAYPFQLSVNLAPSLAQASISSPSHPMRYQASADGIAMTLVGEQGMDRDFVLLIDLPETPLAQAWLAPDQQGSVMLVNQLITSPNSQYRTPVNLKLLVDCSGSMAGESIEKTKQALQVILQQLTPEDQFSITRFGFHSEDFYPDLLPATRQYKHLAKAYIDKMDADLGGTEMESALIHCLSILNRQQHAEASDILLITDGQVAEEEGIITRLKNTSQRVFIVGISDAVSADFLTRLAHSGQGRADFIYPQEEVEPVIQRMFERMRGDAVTGQTLSWSENELDWQTELPINLFAQDSVVFAARFNTLPTQVSANLTLTWKSGATSNIQLNSQNAMGSLAQDLPRIAASVYLKSTPPENARQLAQTYQLLTQDTALFMQLARAANEKGDTDPMLVSIPNALPNSSRQNGIGWVFKRYDASVGSIQNPMFFSQSSASIDNSGFSVSVKEANPTHALIEPLTPEVMLNGQPIDNYLPIQTIDNAHAFIQALSDYHHQLSSPNWLANTDETSMDQFYELQRELESLAAERFYLMWEDELLEDIYDDLLHRLEDRLESCLEALLELMENQAQAYERKHKGWKR